MSKVSVIIPCYNHGQYLDEAVDSILNQTYQDFEIIIVNDGSTDPFTIEKLRMYNKPKTTVIHTENRGPSAARNTGVRAAHGEYILILDADDYFEATFLEKAVTILNDRQEIGGVACGVQYFGTDTKRHIPRGGDVKNFVIENSALGNALIRKMCWEQCGGYDERMKEAGYEDWNFWIDVTKRGWLVHIIPEYLFYYRQHPVSRKTRSHENRSEFVREIVRNHRDLFARYVEDVIWVKELKIQKLQREKCELLNSWSYKLGQILLSPYSILTAIKRRIPVPVKVRAKNFLIQTYYSIFGYQVQCNICHWKDRQFHSDRWHEGVRCPHCGSCVRHRLFWAIVNHIETLHFKKLFSQKHVVHFAPERSLKSVLKQISGMYKTADACAPGYEHKRRQEDYIIDIASMPTIPNESIDCIIAFDVLEHVPNHLHAMAEMYRVLRKQGYCILTVPQIDKLAVTYEDLNIMDPLERERVFGQNDHWRLYGEDFADMLRSAGFVVTAMDEQALPELLVQRHVLFPPVLSTHHLAPNHRKIYFGQKL